MVHNLKDNVFVYRGPEEVSGALAKFLVETINESISTEGICTVALSGGSTPKTLFRVLAGKYRGSVDWSSVGFFWVDERCVPPDDPESNYGMTMENLLGRIVIHPSCIHRIIGENDPDREAVRYSGEIRKFVHSRDGLPCFDIILLGVGEDGHTASIFPGSEELFLDKRICVSATHPVTGQRRITITGKVINNGSCVVILAAGRGKSAIIGEVLGAKRAGTGYPVGRVSPEKGILLWYLDSEAASGIDRAADDLSPVV